MTKILFHQKLSLLSCVLLLLLGTSTNVVKSQVVLPPPSGPYDIGVHDFEFVDDEYPSPRDQDANGRRIMVRVYYPAGPDVEFSGPPKEYITPQEREALVNPFIEAFASVGLDISPLFDAFNGTATNSYVDAPPLSSLLPSTQPIVVFSTGALGYVSSNHALMEALASNGIIVFSVSHPGYTYTLYPNGDSVPVDQDFLTSVFIGDPPGFGDPNITIRHDTIVEYYESTGGSNPHLPRWRDDCLAIVDHIETIIAQDPPTVDTTTERSTDDIILHNLLSGHGGDNSPLKVVYGGMSFGAGASGSATQIDERAVGAFSLDGKHKSLDLFGKEIRVPYLNLFALGPIYGNEFFFEPLTTMGTDPRIYRIAIADTVHLEYTDIMLAPPEVRMMIGGGNANGTDLHFLHSRSIGKFVSMTFGISNDTLTAESLIVAYPEKVSVFDVSYVAEWALSNEMMTSTETSPMSSEEEEPTQSPETSMEDDPIQSSEDFTNLGEPTSSSVQQQVHVVLNLIFGFFVVMTLMN